MAKNIPNKEQLIDGLLNSLYYGKPKEDRSMIDHLYSMFRVPSESNLRDYLIKEVDFSCLFVRLLQLIEPFTKMLYDIYNFLSYYRTDARTAGTKHSKELRQLVISENIKDKLAFDLEVFPVIEKEVLQRLPKKLPAYNRELVTNHNVSPLFLAETLLPFGKNINDKKKRSYIPCAMCTENFKENLERIFEQLSFLIDYINSLSKDDLFGREKLVEEHKSYYVEADKNFREGLHSQENCLGYEHWRQIYHDFLLRFERISTEETWFEQVQGLLRFFELPFWEKRSQLYEIWVLIHFLTCLCDCFSIELTIEKGQWALPYTQASKPVALAHGENFHLELWFQRSFGGKTYTDSNAMPDIVIMGKDARSTRALYKPLVLIECKEREGNSRSDMQKLASFYHEQVQAEKSIYCNYLDYSPSLGFKTYRNNNELFCDTFRPGNPNVPRVDHWFLQYLKRRAKTLS